MDDPNADQRSGTPARGGRGGPRRWLVSSLAGRLVIVALLVGAGFLLRDRLGGAADDLRVGDCFDIPGLETEVTDVQRHPCTEAHTGEVYFVGDFAGAADASYPSGDAFEEYVAQKCLPAFKAYTGSELLVQTLLDGGYLSPTSTGWTGGDREVTCYLYRVDEQPMTRSYRGANP